MNVGLTRFLSLPFWVQLVESIVQTCARFPLTTAALIMLNLVFLDDIHNFNLLDTQQSRNLFLISITGALWFTASTLLAESLHWTKTKFYLLALPIFCVYSAYIFSHDFWLLSSWSFTLAAGLSITFAAWLFRHEDNESVWFFNYQLISNLFFAVLSAVILSAGISLILVSIDYLFEVDIPGKFYSDTWLFGMVLFAPLYFLAKLPKQFDYQRSDCQFSKSILFIMTYVLVPLTLVYMVILYAYFIKISVQGVLPQGQLGKMISAFGVIGIITHLAIYPIHDRSSAILGWFYRHFYLMMIVPLGLLVIAISARILQYGVTEFRYLIVLCAIWFAVLIFYDLFKRQQFHLRYVTLSLALLLLLASFGPWGINQLPVNDQYARLKTSLIKANILVDGKIITRSQQPDFETRQSISSMVDYLVDHHAGDKLRSWMPDPITFDKKRDCGGKLSRCYHSGQDIIELMGINYVERWEQRDSRSRYLEIAIKQSHDPRVSRAISITGYDILIPITWLSTQNSLSTQMLENSGLPTEFHLIMNEQGQLVLSRAQGNILNFDLLALAAQFSTTQTHYINVEQAEKLTLLAHGQGLAGKLYINNLQLLNNKGEAKINTLSGNLLLKFTD